MVVLVLLANESSFDSNRRNIKIKLDSGRVVFTESISIAIIIVIICHRIAWRRLELRMQPHLRFSERGFLLLGSSAMQRNYSDRLFPIRFCSSPFHVFKWQMCTRRGPT